MEAEADDFALQKLLESKIDPMHFARILRRLSAEEGGQSGGKLGEFLSTHPATERRITRFVEASSSSR